MLVSSWQRLWYHNGSSVVDLGVLSVSVVPGLRSVTKGARGKCHRPLMGKGRFSPQQTKVENHLLNTRPAQKINSGSRRRPFGTVPSFTPHTQSARWGIFPSLRPQSASLHTRAEATLRESPFSALHPMVPKHNHQQKN